MKGQLLNPIVRILPGSKPHELKWDYYFAKLTYEFYSSKNAYADLKSLVDKFQDSSSNESSDGHQELMNEARLWFEETVRRAQRYIDYLLEHIETDNDYEIYFFWTYGELCGLLRDYKNHGFKNWKGTLDQLLQKLKVKLDFKASPEELSKFTTFLNKANEFAKSSGTCRTKELRKLFFKEMRKWIDELSELLLRTAPCPKYYPWFSQGNLTQFSSILECLSQYRFPKNSKKTPILLTKLKTMDEEIGILEFRIQKSQHTFNHCERVLTQLALTHYRNQLSRLFKKESLQLCEFSNKLNQMLAKKECLNYALDIAPILEQHRNAETLVDWKLLTRDDRLLLEKLWDWLKNNWQFIAKMTLITSLFVMGILETLTLIGAIAGMPKILGAAGMAFVLLHRKLSLPGQLTLLSGVSSMTGGTAGVGAMNVIYYAKDTQEIIYKCRLLADMLDVVGRTIAGQISALNQPENKLSAEALLKRALKLSKKGQLMLNRCLFAQSFKLLFHKYRPLIVRYQPIDKNALFTDMQHCCENRMTYDEAYRRLQVYAGLNGPGNFLRYAVSLRRHHAADVERLLGRVDQEGKKLNNSKEKMHSLLQRLDELKKTLIKAENFNENGEFAKVLAEIYFKTGNFLYLVDLKITAETANERREVLPISEASTTSGPIQDPGMPSSNEHQEALSISGNSTTSVSIRDPITPSSEDSGMCKSNVSEVSFFASKTWQGILPGTQEGINFRLKKIAGDGNCALEALGIQRDRLVKTLLPLSKKNAAREALWQEIYEAFISKESRLKPPDEKKWAALLDEINIHQLNLDNKRRELSEKREEHQSDHEVEFFPQVGEGEPNTLQVQDSEVTAAEAERKAYCMQAKVFQYYVKSLADPKRKIWVGAQSLWLYAKEKKWTLYIWALDSNRRLTVIHCHRSVPKEETAVFHLLQKGNHFDRLIVTTKLDLALGRNTETIRDQEVGSSSGSLEEEENEELSESQSPPDSRNTFPEPQKTKKSSAITEESEESSADSKFCKLLHQLIEDDQFKFQIMRTNKFEFSIQFTANNTVIKTSDEIRTDLVSLIRNLKNELSDKGLKDNVHYVSRVNFETYMFTITCKEMESLNQVQTYLRHVGAKYYDKKIAPIFFAPRTYMLAEEKDAEKGDKLECVMQ